METLPPANSSADPLTGHDGPVNAIAFHPEGDLLASAGADGRVQLWNSATGELFGDPLTGHDGPVNAIAFHPEGEPLVSCGEDATVRLWWDLRSQQSVSEPLTLHTQVVTSASFHPTGRVLVTGSHDETVRAWDARDSQPIDIAMNYPEITGPVWAVAFHPAGFLMAMPSGDHHSTLRIFATGRLTEPRYLQS